MNPGDTIEFDLGLGTASGIILKVYQRNRYFVEVTNKVDKKTGKRDWTNTDNYGGTNIVEENQIINPKKK
jgi:hypothetical protein